MASTAKKWGIGCGIGCGFLLLVFGGIGTCGYFGFRHIADKAETLEASFDELDAQHGRPKEYEPDPTGRIAPERMETFLAVRDELVPSRAEASGMISVLEEDGANVIGKIKAGVGFIPAMLAYISERNEVLLRQGMGLGEYQYIYAVSYFGHLDKDPSDGPSFRVSGPEDEEEGAGPVRWNVHRHEEEESVDIRADRAREVRGALNESLGAAARNQLEALDRLLAGTDDAQLRAWREQLAAEVEAMESEPRRILWEEGMPPQLRDSIEPFGDRLEASYDELMNVVETGFVNHE